MAINWTVGWDTGSLEELVRLAGYSALLDPEITSALVQAGDLVVTTAQANTWNVFDNPTGTLASNIYFHVVSPKEVEVGVANPPIPYGHRREFSFYGPDSLGRVYPNDIPRPYLIPAVDEDSPLIMTMIEIACDNALARVGAVGGAV